jgi:hypothetical protein
MYHYLLNVRITIVSFFLALLLSLSFLIIGTSFAQSSENYQGKYQFKGNLSVTQNGLSLIPAFSLGRPAAIAELSMGGKRLTFDPEFRFALDGQPWSFIFWWRYKFINTGKFNFHAGAHPAYIFRNTQVVNSQGVMVESMEARRFFATEIVPSYAFSNNLKLSGLYLIGRSLGKVPLEVNQFTAVNLSINNISISDNYFLHMRPMMFYLKMNDKDGYFGSSSFYLGRKNVPLALGSVISRKIVSNIPVDDWIWNVSLIYSFNQEFTKRLNPLL